jgi:hypothetical protein
MPGINISTLTYVPDRPVFTLIDHPRAQDCWSNITGRDTSNRIQPDLNKFPNGIASVASKVHSLGLLFGVYGFVFFLV